MDSKEISPVERHIFRKKRRQDIGRRRSCSGPIYGGSSMNGPPFPTDRPTAHPHRLMRESLKLRDWQKAQEQVREWEIED